MAYYKNCEIAEDGRTESYRFSVRSKSDKDLLALKKDVNLRNKFLRANARRMKDKYGTDRALMYLKIRKLERVKLMARGPRAVWARADMQHCRAYDSSLPHQYAMYFDVYVLTDWTSQRVLETEIQEGLSPSQQAAIARAGYEEAMFKAQQARLLREKYGIVSYYSKDGVRYESKK